MTKLLLSLLLISCNLPQGEDGSNGINGVNGHSGRDGEPGQDGRSYYSYTVNVNLQEIIGDHKAEKFLHNGASFYRLPEKFELMVDNIYPDCDLKQAVIVVDSEQGKGKYYFKAGKDRYKMVNFAQPKINVKSSFLRIYYEGRPRVVCDGEGIELHSSLSGEIRVIEAVEE